nr:rod shape-determining protein RodA [Blochmannia endosymbiont of Polyrhachis (Hedomyrma) turneri]
MYIDRILFFFIILLLIYSLFIMWSASGQNIFIVEKKIIQIIFGLIIMIGLAQIPPRIYETLAPYLYCFCIFLLILVNIYGDITKGAQRWLFFGDIRFQPSELVKIIMPLILARYVHYYDNESLSSVKHTSFVLILILIPTVLVAYQPDLGSAILISISGLFTLFFAGFSGKLIVIIISIVIFSIPIIWFFYMHDYQRDRINTLLNPDLDPLGTGYHITQSKIAIGSGGLTGKGWLNGTQSQLEFLPERHTDFIFSVIGEELGLIGEIVLLLLYVNIIIRGFFIAINAKNIFGRIISSSLMIILFIYVFTNIGMVSGLLPVVGIPLPLVSYGGSALIVFLSSFGIIMSVYIHRDII